LKDAIDGRERKIFFFWTKRSKKNFVNWASAKHHNAMRCLNLSKVFLLLFFKKEELAFSLSDFDFF